MREPAEETDDDAPGRGGPWFYCPGLRPGDNELPGEEARHAAAARRLAVGAAVTLFDGAGRFALGRLAACSRHAVTVAVAEVSAQPAPPRAVTVATALPKGKRWQFLAEKLTELGAAAIVPVRFQRSVVTGSDPESAGRWLREACKQCRRAALPRLAPEIALGAWLAGEEARGLAARGALFLAAPDAPVGMGGAVAPAPGQEAAACIVGPEGGLTDEETAACLAAGARPLSLGPYILRVETAGLAAAATLMNGRW